MKSFFLAACGFLFLTGPGTPLTIFAQAPVGTAHLTTVVIDPGHGGNDSGAASGGIREKDLVLDIGLRLGKKIKNEFPDVTVHYTRSKDVFVPLYKRASIAIDKKADVFISLHANYVSQTSVKGTETFTLGLHRSQENLQVAKLENSQILLEENYSAKYEGFNPNETESYIMFENMQTEYQNQSIDLAALVQKEFTKNLHLVNRGVKQAGFLVLRRTTMPSVLIEIGFISNPAERKFLVSEKGKEKVTESIFNAFSTYKKTIDNRSRFNLMAAGNNSSESDQDKVAVNQSSATRAAKKSDAAGVLSGAPAANPGIEKQIPENKYWYSVQIAASVKNMSPVPANFKGEKEIKMIKVNNYFKYYSGSFSTPAEAEKHRAKLKAKFSDAFVVIVEDGVPRPFKILKAR